MPIEALPRRSPIRAPGPPTRYPDLLREPREPMRPPFPSSAAETFDPFAAETVRVGVVGGAGPRLDALVRSLSRAGLHPFRVPLADTGSFLSMSQEGALTPARLVVVLANADAWALHCRALAWLGGPAGPRSLLVVAATQAAADAVGLPARTLVAVDDDAVVDAIEDMLLQRGVSGSAPTPAADTLDPDVAAGPLPDRIHVPGERVGRYILRRRLGEGGMGVVFEAEDTEHDQRVALKLLLRHGAGAVDRMKREFRLASTLTHPNLLPLYELAQDGETRFFTMKIVSGSHLDIALHEGGLDEQRVKATFRQLVAALRTMHRAGLAHLDVKPPNVLVQPDGRLFLLDYGIARRVDDGEHVHAGTPRYMAPEVIRGAFPDPACDWYSVGATLHHVLTGGPPTPAGPHKNLAGAGALGRLCVDLLSPEPSARAAYREIMARLGGNEFVEAATSPLAPPPALLGRDGELEWLAAQADAARTGPVVASVSGPSGIGKSTLVSHFVDELRVQRSAVVLAGRCFERESIPFQALDGIIDDLRRYVEMAFIAWEPTVQAAAGDLSRLFPGFSTVAEAGDAVAETQVRPRAQEALAELLGRPAQAGPLVLVVDDVQWGDADSGRLLAAALRRRPTCPSSCSPPHGPPPRALRSSASSPRRPAASTPSTSSRSGRVRPSPCSHTRSGDRWTRTSPGLPSPKPTATHTS